MGRSENKAKEVQARASEVFAENGYDRASIREVACRAGLSVPGLYYYARSKEDLLFRLCLGSFEAITRQLDSALAGQLGPAEKVKRLLAIHLGYFAEHVPAMKVVARDGDRLSGAQRKAFQDARRAYYGRWREVLAHLAPALSERELHLATMSLFGMANWIYTWYRPERDGKAEEVARFMAEIFLQGFSRARRSSSRAAWEEASREEVLR